MTSDPNLYAGWDRVISVIVGVVLGFILSEVKNWWSRRKKHFAYLHAIRIEMEFAAARAKMLIDDGLPAPLYRLPNMHFTTCYPELLSDAVFAATESTALMNFFFEVETLNRGLDRTASAKSDTERESEHSRNLTKAQRLVTTSHLYTAAVAAINAHLK